MIQSQAATTPGKKGSEAASEPETHLTKELEENINRMDLGEGAARNVEEAISVLRYGGGGRKKPDRPKYR